MTSCHSKKPSQIELALEQNDTAFAKRLAQKELDSLRSSIKDSSFANTIDAMLLIQTLEFKLQKADSSRGGYQFSEKIILKHTDGQRLYHLMMSEYKQGIKYSTNASDIAYFKNELLHSSQEWLIKRFQNKKTYEALIALSLLQKDIALISAIKNKVDNAALRGELETQYNKLIDNLRKDN